MPYTSCATCRESFLTLEKFHPQTFTKSVPTITLVLGRRETLRNPVSRAASLHHGSRLGTIPDCYVRDRCRNRAVRLVAFPVASFVGIARPLDPRAHLRVRGDVGMVDKYRRARPQLPLQEAWLAALTCIKCESIEDLLFSSNNRRFSATCSETLIRNCGA